MAFLLKIMPTTGNEGGAIVPRMKSAVLEASDIGDTVYVWFGDTAEAKSALHAITTLSGFEEIMVPQVRDPSKSKHAYHLQLAPVGASLIHPLTTDDLGPHRYVEGADGIDSLGRVHRDRNDKIIRLTSSEADVLAERFRQ